MRQFAITIGLTAVAFALLVQMEAGARSASGLEAPPASSGGTTTLVGVSCIRPDACIAVGNDQRPSSSTVFAERWDGHSWSIQTPPMPPGDNAFFEGVSCSVPDACTAVGYYLPPEGVPVKNLAERWNGTAWRIETTPDPSFTTARGLVSVSCTAPNDCMATGRGYVELWNGKWWALHRLTVPGDSVPGGSVSCSSSVACMIVGGDLAEYWNGSQWSDIQLPYPTADADIPPNAEAVSCSRPNVCAAVGSYSSGQEDDGYGATWNGTSWQLNLLPPNPASDTDLGGESCTGPVTCTAVGQSDGTPLAEAWDGSAWTPETTGSLVGGGVLSAVSCSRPGSCVAVGFRTGTSPASTLAENWNGSMWTMDPTPNP
jgi:hypothetical protein